jgi:hypothetical protein
MQAPSVILTLNLETTHILLQPPILVVAVEVLPLRLPLQENPALQVNLMDALTTNTAQEEQIAIL